MNLDLLPEEGRAGDIQDENPESEVKGCTGSAVAMTM